MDLLFLLKKGVSKELEDKKIQPLKEKDKEKRIINPPKIHQKTIELNRIIRTG